MDIIGVITDSHGGITTEEVFGLLFAYSLFFLKY